MIEYRKAVEERTKSLLMHPEDKESFKKQNSREEKIATYFEFFSTVFCSPLITKINKAPISGINMIAERIGKFI